MKKPFFARFLETQELENVQGGQSLVVTKPMLDDIVVTMKWPSDSDEHVTMKYPSDSDEAVEL